MARYKLKKNTFNQIFSGYSNRQIAEKVPGDVDERTIDRWRKDIIEGGSNYAQEEKLQAVADAWKHDWRDYVEVPTLCTDKNIDEELDSETDQNLEQEEKIAEQTRVEQVEQPTSSRREHVPCRPKPEAQIYDSPLSFRDWIVVAVLCKCSSAAVARQLQMPTMDLSHVIADPGTWENHPEICQSMLGIAREVAEIDSSQCSDGDLRQLTAAELMNISTNSCFKAACRVVKVQFQIDSEQRLIIYKNLQQAIEDQRPFATSALKHE